MIVLIDTNVLMSAALRDRLPERLVHHIAGSDKYRWVVTPEILNVYVGVLRRPKFKLGTDIVDQWAELLAGRTFNVGSPPAVPEFKRDPKDAPFLAAALAAHAVFLITGDKDLLELGVADGTRIVSVSQFCGEFGIA